MIDRMPDFLRIIRSKEIEINKKTNAVLAVDNENMKEITSLVLKGNRVINNIREEADKLKSYKDQAIKASSSEKENEVKRNIEQCLEVLNSNKQEGKNIADNLKIKINTYKDELKQKSEELKEEEYGKCEIRVINNLNGTYLNNFKEALSYSQNVENDIKTAIQKKILRSAEEILGKELDEDQKKDFLENPEKLQQLYENRLTHGLAHVKLRNMVSDLENRHKEILNLEKNVNQVNRLFLDLALLVDQQGEMIDNIEMNIKDARNFVEKGEKDIEKAKEYQDSARKVSINLI